MLLMCVKSSFYTTGLCIFYLHTHNAVVQGWFALLPESKKDTSGTVVFLHG